MTRNMKFVLESNPISRKFALGATSENKANDFPRLRTTRPRFRAFHGSKSWKETNELGSEPRSPVTGPPEHPFNFHFTGL